MFLFLGGSIGFGLSGGGGGGGVLLSVAVEHCLVFEECLLFILGDVRVFHSYLCAAAAVSAPKASQCTQHKGRHSHYQTRRHIGQQGIRRLYTYII